jgi:predicted permease
MSVIRSGVRRLFRLAIRRPELAKDDVDREIAFHLEERVRQLVASGMTPAEADAEARRRFGDLDASRAALGAQAVRQEQRLALGDRLEALGADLRYVMRSLGRARGFTAVAVLTLALGIGANAAMFGIIDRLLLRGPAHVQDPDRVVRLYGTVTRPGSGSRTSSSFGYVTYALMREQARLLDGAAAYASPNPVVVGTGDDGAAVPVARATWDFFPLVGVRPALGRFFSRDEDLPPDGRRVVVLGHSLWRRQFAGDSAIIGREARVGGETYTVVGVAPEGFTGVELQPVDAWLPLSLTHPVTNWPTAWNAQWLVVLARLKASATSDAASAEATAIYQRGYGGTNQARARAVLAWQPTRFAENGREAPETAVARWLVGVSLVVLLVACANVANLLLARGFSRRREVALRLAIGISAWRLRRLLLLESLVLALAGCIAGLILAWWGGAAIRALLLPDVAWLHGPVDARVFAVAAGLALACGLAIGLVPAWGAARVALAPALRTGSAQAGSQRASLRSALLFAQCALSVVLLVGAGLFVTSLQRARGVPLGFDPSRVVRVQIGWPRAENAPAEPERRAQVYAAALERLRATPGISKAAIAVGTPFGFSFGVDLRVPGYDSIPALPGGGPYLSVVTDDYFDVMQTRVADGRAFTTADRAGSERVVVVNEPMARTLWPRGAIGQCMYVFSDTLPCARVVGVVAEMRRNALREPPAMQYYVPLGQEQGVGGSALMILPGRSVESVEPMLRQMLREIDPSILGLRVEPLPSVIDPLHRQWKLGASLFSLFGLLALVITAVGLYGVIAYLVAQRTAEFGVRMALGATRRGIVGLVVAGGLPVAAAGLATGLVVALLAAPSVQGLLFESSARDPRVIAGAGLALLIVAMAACVIPAARAARTDPVTALRAE